jgi:hypothetical protein
MDTYGFIITRHVNSEKTNKYWNNCVMCIRMFYPYKKIVIIGAGVSTQYGVLHLLKNGYEPKCITIIDKGNNIHNRKPEEVDKWSELEKDLSEVVDKYEGKFGPDSYGVVDAMYQVLDGMFQKK